MNPEFTEYIGFFISIVCFIGGFYIGYQKAISDIFRGDGGGL